MGHSPIRKSRHYISLTGGGRSVGIVRLRTKDNEGLFLCLYHALCMYNYEIETPMLTMGIPVYGLDSCHILKHYWPSNPYDRSDCCRCCVENDFRHGLPFHSCIQNVSTVKRQNLNIQCSKNGITVCFSVSNYQEQPLTDADILRRKYT
jgi:hypothetical protein